MSREPQPRRRWRSMRGLIAPLLLWCVFIAILVSSLRQRMLHADDEYDQAALREWIEESRVYRESLPDMVRAYLKETESSNPQPDMVAARSEEIHDHLQALCDPTKLYQGQLPLFPAIYRLEVAFRTNANPPLPPIVWESGVPRPRGTGEVQSFSYPVLGGGDERALLRAEYQLHAFNRRQRDEQVATNRLRWIGALAIGATVLAFVWIFVVQSQERERERQRALALQQVSQAERLVLEGELRRQDAENRHQEAERKLLEQRLATQAAEQHALELKSQLYASIGIMAGSYAHNIKNLLVRPNDLLRRCLEGDGLSMDQDFMIREVRQTLGTVTERLQQILHTVRRDPTRAEMVRLDLNRIACDTERTWKDLAREKWKLSLEIESSPEPLMINGDLSHLQQAVENLLFNARDATFEMRSHLREQARSQIAYKEMASAARNREAAAGEDGRQALIAAAAWRGTVVLRACRDGERAILEVQDNGIGMSEEVRRRCTETHFSTKRDNAIYEGNTTGMGLGLSFVTAVLEHHRGKIEIESKPLQGAVMRLMFPLASLSS
jgi:signal transduction histidine kinase